MCTFYIRVNRYIAGLAYIRVGRWPANHTWCDMLHIYLFVHFCCCAPHKTYDAVVAAFGHEHDLLVSWQVAVAQAAFCLAQDVFRLRVIGENVHDAAVFAAAMLQVAVVTSVSVLPIRFISVSFDIAVYRICRNG